MPDDMDARLVVLGPDHPYSKEAGNPAELAAKEIFERRGTAPRLFRNALVFLAVDKTRLQDLDEAVRRFLAWDSILADKERLDLSPYQVKQAETQHGSADGTVAARLPEAYQWLLVPGQATPQSPVEWQATRLSGQDPLAVRASKKLRTDELLVTALAGTRLRMELDRIPLWPAGHVAVRQLAEHFARYPYLPRASHPDVLVEAAASGVGLLTWESDSFAYADSYDEGAHRYRGLRCGQQISVASVSSGLLVSPEVARAQLDTETKPAPGGDSTGAGAGGGGSTGGADTGAEAEPPAPPLPPAPKRFHGSVRLSPGRIGHDAAEIGAEVVAHLVGLPNADVTVTLEIEAEIPAGATERVVRIVTENSRTLKFTDQGFEDE